MHGGLLTPIFAALVLGLSGPHAISALFSWRPLLLIGESSYCLYLLHFNVFQLIHTYHVPERLHLAALDPWLSYAILVLLALAVFHFFELSRPAKRSSTASHASLALSCPPPDRHKQQKGPAIAGPLSNQEALRTKER